MLTTNQQEIINAITNEFNRINEPIKKNGLIDIASIKTEYTTKQKRISEINLIYKEFYNVRKKLILSDCKRLNKDLNQLNLKAEPNNFSSIIITIINGHLSYLNKICIDYNFITKYDEIGKTDFIIGIEYKYDTRVYPNGLEGITNYENFNVLLKDLYELTLN